MGVVEGETVGGPGVATESWRAPAYPRLPGDTTASLAARGSWIAQQHFVYEVSNDADIILLSMATREPLVTVVLQPDDSIANGFRVARCRTVAEQHAFYRGNRSRRHIAESDVFTAVGGDWYGFVEGLLTHRVLDTGELTSTHMCGLLPVSMVEDAIIGEIGFGVPVVDQPAGAIIEQRRRMRRVQNERTRALQAADLDRLGELYAPAATVVERAYPSGAQVVLSGQDSIVAFYGERLSQWSKPRVEEIVSTAQDWYGFEELLWAGHREGRSERFRTAAVSHLAPGDGAIAYQIGYGTAVTSG